MKQGARTRADAAVPAWLRDDVRVVDGFYADPAAVRALALRSEFRDYGSAGNFPGRESVKAFWTVGLVEHFARTVGRPIRFDPAVWVFGKFRLAGHDAMATTKVHIDKVDWTAVVYLSLDGVSVGGLGIYEHVGLGLAQVPAATGLSRFGCTTLEEFDERYVLPCSTSPSAWRLLHTVPVRYNRCVVFRGSRRFHGITDLFGSDPSTARLSQNFFFMEAGTR